MKYFEADLLLHVPPLVSQSTWVVLLVTKFTFSLAFPISVQQCHCTSLMLSPSLFSRILDLLFIFDPIFTLFSRTILPFYPCFAVDLGYNMERTRVAQLNYLVRYGTVPGSGIYGTIPRSAQMVPRYGTYSARPKNRSCKHPIPKEFWNNEHAESRLAILYLNCYRQAESRLLIIPKFFGPEILEFCPRSNQRKKLEFRAQLAARAQNADFSWKSDEVRTVHSSIPKFFGIRCTQFLGVELRAESCWLAA